MLLAGRHLEPELFDRLAAEVENLFFCYVITREPTRTFERNFARWATELRKVNSLEQFDTFISERFDKEKATLANRFDDAIGRLELGKLQLYRMVYILGKLSQQVDINAYGETPGTAWLDHYMSSGFEIEHIYPQNPTPDALEEFGEISDPTIVQRLGNLVLAEKSINASLGNRPYSEKRPVYQQSKLLLTRALSERPKVGANTRIDRAVAKIEPYPNWNEGSINDRQKALGTLSRAIWGMPERQQAFGT
ncbi:HNH endonuclease family protein [Paracoccus sp. XHP0099]|uniref:HNH endonuclease family protein n=1 Tax=Paracoccus marinaquae TaxID=2841926 RepID=A0ABS6AMN7_9RHOB|nr:HNH endonuclease family protein [Paracoccus marinaquae]